jgi:diguanylate cyclase (GGDEF)-like protein
LIENTEIVRSGKIETDSSPFGILSANSATFDLSPSRLLGIGAEYLSRLQASAKLTEVVVHLPKGISDEFLHQLGVEEPLKPGELQLIRLESMQRPTVRSIGRLMRNAPARADLFFIFLIPPNMTAVAVARKNRNGLWETAISTSRREIRRVIRGLQDQIDTSEVSRNNGNAINLEELVQESGEESPDGATSLVAAILAEIGGTLEQKNRRVERDLKWYRTITRIQDAVGWELDGNKLNNAVARILKSSVGYDYLELTIVQPSGRSFETVTTFQRNDTAFGGNLLSVILHPERQEELLKGHKPIVVNEVTAGRWLMNPRLMGFMGLASGILVPLVYQRRSNGLLKLFSRIPAHYVDDDLERMEAIGRVLAKSIENAKIHALMRRMATVDGLTNVYNHRFFSEQLLREFKRAHRYKNSLSLLMLDIDYFKHYNDTNGHLQGDYVLATVSKLLKQNVREVDLVCRYGGEEFTVILPETDMEQAKFVAEKVRKSIEDYPFKAGSKQPNGKLTISIGIAEGVTDIESPAELVNRADVALYRAKKAGRNRCEAF